MFQVVAVIAAVLLASSAHAENLVEIAAEIGSFKTLIRALEVADLKESLSAEGPYTLFAPTDDAFAQFLRRRSKTSCAPKIVPSS